MSFKLFIFILFYVVNIKCLDYSVKVCDFINDKHNDCFIEAEPLDTIYIKCPKQKLKLVNKLANRKVSFSYREAVFYPTDCFIKIHLQKEFLNEKHNFYETFIGDYLNGAIATPGSTESGVAQLIAPVFVKDTMNIYCGCNVSDNASEPVIRAATITVRKNEEKLKGCDFTYMGKPDTKPDMLNNSFLTKVLNPKTKEKVCEVDIYPGETAGIICSSYNTYNRTKYEIFYKPKECFKRVYIDQREVNLNDFIPLALNYPNQTLNISPFKNVFPRYVTIPRDNKINVDLECSCVHVIKGVKIDAKMIIHVKVMKLAEVHKEQTDEHHIVDKIDNNAPRKDDLIPKENK